MKNFPPWARLLFGFSKFPVWIDWKFQKSIFRVWRGWVLQDIIFHVQSVWREISKIILGCPDLRNLFFGCEEIEHFRKASRWEEIENLRKVIFLVWREIVIISKRYFLVGKLKFQCVGDFLNKLFPCWESLKFFNKTFFQRWELKFSRNFFPWCGEIWWNFSRKHFPSVNKFVFTRKRVPVELLFYLIIRFLSFYQGYIPGIVISWGNQGIFLDPHFAGKPKFSFVGLKFDQNRTGNPYFGEYWPLLGGGSLLY